MAASRVTMWSMPPLSGRERPATPHTTQIPFSWIYSAMLIGGVLLIVHFLLIVKAYVLRREFASDAHFDAAAAAAL